MTFCIGIRVDSGLVVLSDTRVVRGSERSRKSKLSSLSSDDCEAVVMTSGLRSISDKVLTRLEDRLEASGFDRVHEFATSYGELLRQVRDEDGPALADAGLTFNSNALIAGRFAHDAAPALIHIYPEGNWVRATDDAPYFIIGRSSYGKPILDRLLGTRSSLKDAASLAYLAFDATSASAIDVGYPIDIGIQPLGDRRFTTCRLTEDDLHSVHAAWHEHLRSALDRLPTPWGAIIDQERSA